VSLDDRAGYGQTQACIAWAAFAPGWIGSIESVEDLANVLGIDGYPAVTHGKRHAFRRLLDLH
jgi:hypothetical protein